MKAYHLEFGFLGSNTLLCLIAFMPTMAQVVPDTTLPNNSLVIQQNNTSVIEGGTQAGSNLFHSFREFSVPIGGEAFFKNAVDIQNIFSRVTGDSISNIDGLIRANGTANLFLLNPNGIIFGSNAQLNIGGSFLATTANSIKFADGTFFSTANPRTSPLLTISVPVGLQMGLKPGNIVVQGPGHNLSYNLETLSIIRDNRPVGLQVAPGQTLALLGGNLALEGGNLTAEDGRVELGSIGGETLVTLTSMNSGIALSYPGIENFQDIGLSRAASIDVSGAGGGDVFIVGRQITLTDGSGILAHTEGTKPGGTLRVRASEVVEAIGTTPDVFPSGLFADVQPGAIGDGSNLTIETARLQLVNGTQVSTTTFGLGKGGNLTVKATDTVELIGTSTVEVIGTSASGKLPSSLLAAVVPGATGDGGNLSIETARLRVTDGAQVSTSTVSSGKAGNLTVKATNMVELIGRSGDGFPSSLSAAVGLGATGEGGNLTIETARLQVVNGVVLTGSVGSGKAGNLTVKATDTVELIRTSANSAFASGLFASAQRGATGDGGNVTIETARLQVVNGSQVQTSTFGLGKAGNLTVKATDTVELIGTSANKAASGLFASVEFTATGDGGSLTIETARLRVTDGARVSVSSAGEGKAGNLIVDAGSIWIENSSSLRAVTKAGGGSIELRSPSITLRRGSQINTNATGSATGGNININTNTLTALENSDISANSLNAQGGTVTINAQAIFGAQPRTREELSRLLGTQDTELLAPARLPSSDITATGKDASLSGTLAINTPDINPGAGLVELSQDLVDATALVTSGCRPKRGEQSQFTITGRGGLPPSPYEAIDAEATWVDFRLITIAESGQPNRSSSSDSPPTQHTAEIIEAQGWMVNEKGQITLVTQLPEVTAFATGLATNCDPVPSPSTS